MSIPSDRRSVSSILNNLIGRVRVLEALPSDTGPIWWLKAYAGAGDEITVPTATPTLLPLYPQVAGNDDTNPLQPPTFADPYAIEINRSGLYLMQAEVSVDTPGTYDRSVVGVVGDTNPPTGGYDWHGTLNADIQFTSGQTLTWQAVFGLLTIWPLPLYAGLEFEQSSGGDVEARGSLTLIRLGPYL